MKKWLKVLNLIRTAYMIGYVIVNYDEIRQFIEKRCAPGGDGSASGIGAVEGSKDRENSGLKTS